MEEKIEKKTISSWITELIEKQRRETLSKFHRYEIDKCSMKKEYLDTFTIFVFLYIRLFPTKTTNTVEVKLVNSFASCSIFDGARSV